MLGPEQQHRSSSSDKKIEHRNFKLQCSKFGTSPGNTHLAQGVSPGTNVIAQTCEEGKTVSVEWLCALKSSMYHLSLRGRGHGSHAEDEFGHCVKVEETGLASKATLMMGDHVSGHGTTMLGSPDHSVAAR